MNKTQLKKYVGDLEEYNKECEHDAWQSYCCGDI
jgi:hypothetical protein